MRFIQIHVWIAYCFVQGSIIWVNCDARKSKEGSTVVLQCPIQPVLFWTDRDENTIYSMNLTINGGISDRITITKDYKLMIQNLSFSDERTYRCEGVNADGIVTSFDIRLQVSREPKNMRIQNLSNPKEVFAYEGEQYKLTCTVDSGIPPESLKWYSDQQIVAAGGPGVLIYSWVPNKSNERKKYTCIASNDVTTPPLNKTVTLRLYSTPKVHVTAYPSTNVNEGKQLNISCRYESNLVHDDVYWYKLSYKQFDISSNGSFNIFISNLSKEDEGNYVCRVKNRIGIGEANITVTVNFRPTIFSRHKNNYTTHLEEAKLIMLRVESFPEPSVSWANTAGGKLGVWNITRDSRLLLYNNVYILKSSIKPTKEEHFGLYMVAIRNDVGSIEVSLQLHIDRFGITVEPSETTCIASSSLYITCNTVNADNTTLNVRWKHYFYGELVQTFKGKLTRQKSILSISHCDYRDGGDYVCEWMANGMKLSGWSSVSILGPPIISQETISFQDTLVYVSLDIYCEGQAFEVIWYINDIRLNESNKDYKIYMQASNVSIEVHTHMIDIEGFNAKLVFDRKHIPNINQINCQVRKNSYSSEVVIGKDDLLGNIFTEMSDKTSTKIYKDVTIVTSTTDSSEEIRYSLYISVPTTAVFIVILVIGVVLFLRSGKGTENIPQQMDMQNREPDNVPAQIGDMNNSNEDHYDEIASDIGSTYYHSVEWQNTVIDSDDSESQSSTLDKECAEKYTFDNVYEGLDILFIEPTQQHSDFKKMKRTTI